MAKQTFTTGQVLTAAQMTSLQETAMGGGPATAKTASYVLVAADAGTTVAMNAAGATTITVNTGLFAAGDTVFIQNLGAGACTVTAGTATVATAGSLILPQNDAGILYFTSASAAIFYDYVQPGITSPVTTKGDLYSFSTTDARLAVGNNGETLVADSSTTTGLRYTAGTIQTNPVLNSAMQVWQRGTSIATSAGNVYLADRWATTAAGSASTISRQSTNDTTNLPNIQYCMRFQRNSGQTNTTAYGIYQAFETVNTIPYAGKTVTWSFYARAGANYSPTSSLFGIQFITGTGTDQNPNSGGYTGQTLPVNSTVTITTTWARYSVTLAIPSTATEMTTQFYMAPTGTAGANDYFEITGVQIDIGSVALPFRTYAGTIQGELAACQRYYYRATIDEIGGRIGSGYVNGTTEANITIPFPVQMRTKPTALEQSGTAADYQVLAAGNVTTTCNLVPAFVRGAVFQAVVQLPVASGITAGQGVTTRFATVGAYFGWSAEL